MSIGGGNETTVSIKSQADVAAFQAMQQELANVNKWLETLNLTMSRSIGVQTQMAGSLARVTDAHQQMGSATDKTTTSMGFFEKILTSTIAKGAEFATGFLSVEAALGLATKGFDMLGNAIEAAEKKLWSMLDTAFKWSVEAQQMEYLWRYQYGGLQGGGPAIASQTAAWLPNFAMNSPYTLQQIMGAVGPLSQLGLSFQGLQRYLPLISDLSATHTSIFGGGGMLPIQYGALAVMEATKGYSRRLLMELQIRPNELEPYGLKFVGNKESGQLANPEMFLPALEAYAKDKGYLGASKKIAHETWSGLYNSLVDRVMAFGRRSMGEDIPDPTAGNLSQSVIDMISKGDISGALKAVGADQASMKSYGINFTKSGGVTDRGAFQDALQQFSQDKLYASYVGKPEFKDNTIFSVMLKTLQDFSAWWDAHQDTVDKVSKFVSDVGGMFLNLARTSASNALTSLWGGFSKAFSGDSWVALGTNFMKMLQDPRNQDLIQRLGNFAGNALGTGLTKVGGALNAGFTDFSQWISDPNNQRAIEATAKTLLDTLGGSLHEVVQDVRELHKNWDDFMSLFTDEDRKTFTDSFKDLSKFGDIIGALGGQVGRFLKVLDDLWQGLKLIGEALSGHMDTVAMMNWSAEYMKDVTALMTVGTVNITVNAPGADVSKLLPTAASYHQATKVTPHTPGAGPNVSYGAGLNTIGFASGFYGAGGASVVQNNHLTVVGASGQSVQKIVDRSESTAARNINRAIRTVGGWSNNRVGLF